MMTRSHRLEGSSYKNVHADHDGDTIMNQYEDTAGGSGIVTTSVTKNRKIEISIGSDASGEIYYRESDGEWEPAVYHSKIRHDLIEAASRRGSYDIPPATGEHEDDQTSFLETYKSIGPDRDHRHEILFVYEEPEDLQNPSYEVDPWYYEGRLVVDLDNNKVMTFGDTIPDTLASVTPAHLIETMKRLDSRIRYQDIRARMPPKFLKKVSEQLVEHKIHEVKALANTLNHFRMAASCLAWEQTAVRNKYKEYLDSVLPRACKEANSTKAFRDLEAQEITRIQFTNLDELINNAGKAKQKKLRQAGTPGSTLENYPMEQDGASEDEYAGDEATSDQSTPEASNREFAEGNQGTLTPMDAAERKRVGINPDWDVRDTEVVRRFHNSMMEDLPGLQTVVNVDDEHNRVASTGSRDARNARPSNWEDVHSIQDALERTRLHFVRLTRQLLPVTPIWRSYLSQSKILQEKVDVLWTANKHGNTSPSLIVLDSWSGRICDWSTNPRWIGSDVLTQYSPDRQSPLGSLLHQQVCNGEKMYQDVGEEIRQAKGAEEVRNQTTARLSDIDLQRPLRVGTKIEPVHDIIARTVEHNRRTIISWRDIEGRARRAEDSRYPDSLSWPDLVEGVVPSGLGFSIVSGRPGISGRNRDEDPAVYANAISGSDVFMGAPAMEGLENADAVIDSL